MRRNGKALVLGPGRLSVTQLRRKETTKGVIIGSGELRRGLMSLLAFVPPQRRHRQFFSSPSRAAGGADS